MEIWKVCLLGENLLITTSGCVFPTQHTESLRLVRLLALAGPDGMVSETLARKLYEDSWEDPQNGLRTQLARLNKRARAVAGTPLVERIGDRVVFIREFTGCDLWEFREAVELAQFGGPDAERRAFGFLDSISSEQSSVFQSGCLPPDQLERIVAELLKSLLSLAVLPTASHYRLNLLRAASLVRKFLPRTSLNTEALLKLYAAAQCREEVLQTFLDFENYLMDEVGEKPSGALVNLCESLLVQLETPSKISLFNAPPAPEETFGRSTLIQIAAKRIQAGGRIYVGGVSGVGKTHLMQCVVNDVSLKLFRVAWINLSEVSPEDVSTYLPGFAPDVVILDGYTARYAPTLNFLQSMRKFHAFVVVGSAPIGFHYDECIKVEPLAAGTNTNPGPATRLLEKLIGEPVTSKGRSSAVSLAKISHGLPFSLKLISGLVNTFGLGGVEGQFALSPRSVNNSTQFLQTAVLKTLEQFDAKSTTAVSAIAGFRERIPLSLVGDILSLDLWELKQLADSGLIEIFRDPPEVKISDTVADLLQDQPMWARSNPAQIEFEKKLCIRCQKVGIRSSLDETLISHLRTYFHALHSSANRGEFLTTIQLLSALRPHPGVFTNVEVDPSELQEVIWGNEFDPDEFISHALAIGTVYFYRKEAIALEKFLLEVLSSPQFSQAPRTSQIEVYSQLGLALRMKGQLDQSEKIYETAIGMCDANCPPSLLLKLYYNKSITHASQHRFADALHVHREAIKLAEFAADDNARVELLHTEAICMREAGLPESDVKSALQVALAMARMYKLVPQQGWILQNAVKLLPSVISDLEGVVLCSVGIQLHIEEGLSAEVRFQIKGTCELLYECLKSLGHQALALEAKLLMERLGNEPLYDGGFDVHRSKGDTEFQLPFSIESSIVHAQELQSLSLACLRTFCQLPEVGPAMREWGIHPPNWDEELSDHAINSLPNQVRLVTTG